MPWKHYESTEVSWMLKSCRNFERSDRSKVRQLEAFETVEF